MSYFAHVIPTDDLREHIPYKWCECRPEVSQEDELVIVHQSWDGREHHEDDHDTSRCWVCKEAQKI